MTAPPADPRRAFQARLEAGKPAEARALAEDWTRRAPKDAAAWIALGVALRAEGHPSASVPAYVRALEINPRDSAALSNLGNALKDLMRYDEAIAAHRRSIEIAPGQAGSLANLGVALRDAGRFREALDAFDRAVALDPTSLYHRFDRAQMRLLLGDFARGWEDFEARWEGHRDLPAPRFRQPRWNGGSLPDKTLLLWPEQGFGDTLLAARYAALARGRVGRVVLGCQPELARLFAGLPGADAVVRYGDALPPYDVQCPLMGLPRLFATDLSNIPPAARLSVPPDSMRKLAPALAAAGGRVKVGIVWSGSVTFRSNHQRASALEPFLRFAEVPGVQLFSLQKGPRAAELDQTGARALVVDLAPLLDDFADTAAAVLGLDLVIMTDSSVAHLAGSLGKPVWNLLPALPYWLYLTERADSPWYPSMRLFRQARMGEWAPVFDAARHALLQFVAARLARRPRRAARA